MKQRANLRSPLFLQYESRPAEVEAENLLLYSEQFDNSAWSKSNATIEVNSIVSPNGELTADKLIENTANSTHKISDAITSASNDIYTFSIFAKGNGVDFFHLGMSDASTGQASVLVNIGNGTIDNGTIPSGSWTNVSGNIESYGSGWYRVSVTGQKNSGTQIQPNVELYNGNRTYTGDGVSGVYIFGAQVELNSQATSYIKTEGTTVTRAATTAAQEEDVTAELRIYNGGGGYDYERTNLQVYSEQFDDSAWSKTRATIIADQELAPRGTNTADKLTGDGTGTSYFFDGITFTSGKRYSISIFVKRINVNTFVIQNFTEFGTATFDIQNGTLSGVSGSIESQNIEILSNDWYRCSAVYNCTSTGSKNIGYGIQNYDGEQFYLWGAQVEQGDYTTSYIKTEATEVTELSYQTEAPTEATYTLNRTPNNAKATFEVSELVRDYIEQTLENTSGTTWLEVTLSDSIQLPRHYHFLCTEGYIDNTEGLQTYLNAPSNETFMQSNSTILIPEGQYLDAPVNAQYNSFYTITTGGVEGSAQYFSNLDDNTTQIEYITIKSTDEVVKLYVDSVVTEEITIQQTECSKYANNKLLFVNKYGAKQEFYVNMKSTEKIRVKDDGFSRNVIDYTNLSVTNGLHSYKRRVLESKEMYTLNTPFLDEENVQAFEELLLSEYVWYKKEGGDYIPVIIKDSNMARKTHLNDKLIQYTIEVESANNLINIQR